MNLTSVCRRIWPVLRAVLLIFLALVVFTAILPYWFPPKLPEEEKAAFDPAAFYGDAPCGDRVALVETPSDGLAARMQLLGEAQHTLDISYYGMPMGETTDQFLAGVLAAAERGVQVRILVDGASGGLTWFHPDYARALGAHPNIQLKIYNPPSPLAPWTYNGRLHDKYILADGRLLLLGGRNIGDRYFGAPSYEKPLSLDRDVLVYSTGWQPGQPDVPGSAAEQVRAYMDSIWDSHAAHQPFERDSAGAARVREKLLALADTLPQTVPQDWPALTLPAARITLLHNGGDPGPKAPAVAWQLGQLLLSGKESVLLQSPYIVPDGPMMDLLTALGRTVPDCTILTNSLSCSPNLPAFSCYRASRSRIREQIPSLMEYQGPDALHAKTYLIDGRLALIGSYNMDPRSSYIDTELLLAIDSPALAQVLQAELDGYLSGSLQVGPQGGYLPGPAAEAPAGPLKTGLARLLGLVLVPFRALV